MVAVVFNHFNSVLPLEEMAVESKSGGKGLVSALAASGSSTRGGEIQVSTSVSVGSRPCFCSRTPYLAREAVKELCIFLSSTR